MPRRIQPQDIEQPDAKNLDPQDTPQEQQPEEEKGSLSGVKKLVGPMFAIGTGWAARDGAQEVKNLHTHYKIHQRLKELEKSDPEKAAKIAARLHSKTSRFSSGKGGLLRIPQIDIIKERIKNPLDHLGNKRPVMDTVKKVLKYPISSPVRLAGTIGLGIGAGISLYALHKATKAHRDAQLRALQQQQSQNEHYLYEKEQEEIPAVDSEEEKQDRILQHRLGAVDTKIYHPVMGTGLGIGAGIAIKKGAENKAVKNWVKKAIVHPHLYPSEQLGKEILAKSLKFSKAPLIGGAVGLAAGGALAARGIYKALKKDKQSKEQKETTEGKELRDYINSYDLTNNC